MPTPTPSKGTAVVQVLLGPPLVILGVFLIYLKYSGTSREAAELPNAAIAVCLGAGGLAAFVGVKRLLAGPPEQDR